MTRQSLHLSSSTFKSEMYLEMPKYMFKKFKQKLGLIKKKDTFNSTTKL